MKRSVFKKLLSIFMLTAMLIATSLSALAMPRELPVTVFVDGEEIIFDVEPIIEDGRTLVPMRYIFEALGAEVDWIGETSTAVAVKGDIKIEITVGKNEMLKNGSTVALDVPAKLIDGRTLVPARAVSEGMEAKVDWDGELRKVIITSKTEPETTQKTEYKSTELSPEDTKKLKEWEYDFRYTFEQQILPAELLSVSTELVPYIENKSDTISNVTYEIWDANLASVIMEMQINSEDNYLFDSKGGALTTEDLIASYSAIAKEVGMDAVSNFESAYVTTPGGKTALLLTFANTKYDDPLAIVSKYIAVVPDGDNCRYFTAEISPISQELMGYEVWICSEITLEGRGNYGALEKTTKEAFLGNIDSIIDEKLTILTPAN